MSHATIQQKKSLTPRHKVIHFLLLDTLRTLLRPWETTTIREGVEKMKYKFTAAFNIEGKAITHKMEYDSVDIVKTLERRLKTAFPNATGIQITLDKDEPELQVVQDEPKTPKGVK